jgi:hypothetical protein
MMRKKLPAITIILLSIIVLALSFQHRSADWKNGWQSVVGSDGRGYYAYLPALLVYRDMTFDSCASAERRLLENPDYSPEYLVNVEGQTVNKYFAGVALLQLPFFVVAELISMATGFPVTGYSLPFQVMAGLAALFYLICGLWFLQQLLKRFVSNDWVIAFVLTAFTLGTNLLYYTVGSPLMSHVYSFFAVNGFLWAVLRFTEYPSGKWRFLTGFFLGTVILIRPVNALIMLMVPVIAGSFSRTRIAIMALYKFPKIAWFLIPLLAILFFQPLLWFLQTGHWFMWSYTNEGFNLLHPEVTNVLFSFRKGLFMYTPITLISLAGLIYLYKPNKHLFFILLIFLILFIFLLSSWWNWYYGDGFGMRPAIDFYGCFAILLATAIDRSEKIHAGILTAAVTLCIFLNLFQSWQYSKGIIHPYNMDRQKYGYVFLRTGDRYRNSLGGSDEIPWYGTRTDKPCYRFRERNVYIDSLSKYNTGPNLGASLLPVIPGRYWLSGSFYVRDLSMGASNEIWFVLSIFKADSVRDYWYGFRINDIPVNDTLSYRPIHFAFNSPVITNPGAFIKTYLWNPQKKMLKVVDFSLDFYPPQPDRSGVE